MSAMTWSISSMIFAVDGIDLVGDVGRRDIGRIDIFDVGVGQRAAVRQRLVDLLVQ